MRITKAMESLRLGRITNNLADKPSEAIEGNGGNDGRMGDGRSSYVEEAAGD